MSEPQVLSMDRIDLYEELLKPSIDRLEHLQSAGVFDAKVAIDNLIATVRAKETECAAMREALTTLEWVSPSIDGPFCAFCGNFALDGHKSNCSLHRILSSTAGAQWLERYKAMERFYYEIRLLEVSADTDAILRKLKALGDENTL